MERERTYIIAEAGVNHNGDLERAKEMVEVAAEAGADAVKFQTFRAEKLVVRDAPKADYQLQATGSEESQFEMIKRLELDLEAHRSLIAHCEVCGIEFLSTPFDAESAELLAHSLNLSRIKLGSGEITNAPLLLHIARIGKPVILSTGMSTLGEIETALAVLAFGYSRPEATPSREAFREAYVSAEGRKVLAGKVTLLHCTTEYPAPLGEVNLRAMESMHAAFGLPVGFSDHTEGITVPIAAVARGAVLVEKHFTLDRALPGPDHRASLEPGELRAMVRAIRDVELALGSGVKVPAPSELGNAAVARKSLVASRAIPEGALFSPENLCVKRPGTGIAPICYWEWLGRSAGRDYAADELIA